MKAVVEQRHLTTLSTFVVRARRVEEHSLLSDKKRMQYWASGNQKVRVIGGAPFFVIDLPNEEIFDSLAARCRPFVLKGDVLHYGRVMNALGYFAEKADDEEVAAHVVNLRKSWQRLAPEDFDPLAYMTITDEVDGSVCSEVSDKLLAYAWLYGDLVHADIHWGDRIGSHDINSRYRSGVLLIARIVMRVIMTLNLVKLARGNATVDLDEKWFKVSVTAQTSAELPVTGLAVGPVGTTLSDLMSQLNRSADVLDALRPDRAEEEQ